MEVNVLGDGLSSQLPDLVRAMTEGAATAAVKHAEPLLVATFLAESIRLLAQPRDANTEGVGHESLAERPPALGPTVPCDCPPMVAVEPDASEAVEDPPDNIKATSQPCDDQGCNESREPAAAASSGDAEASIRTDRATSYDSSLGGLVFDPGKSSSGSSPPPQDQAGGSAQGATNDLETSDPQRSVAGFPAKDCGDGAPLGYVKTEIPAADPCKNVPPDLKGASRANTRWYDLIDGDEMGGWDGATAVATSDDNGDHYPVDSSPRTVALAQIERLRAHVKAHPKDKGAAAKLGQLQATSEPDVVDSKPAAPDEDAYVPLTDEMLNIQQQQEQQQLQERRETQEQYITASIGFLRSQLAIDKFNLREAKSVLMTNHTISLGDPAFHLLSSFLAELVEAGTVRQRDADIIADHSM